MSIFPIIQPSARTSEAVLPLCRETAWDFDKGTPIFRAGAPAQVTGKEAVKVWIWKALRTERFRYEIYTRAFGADLEGLIGRAYTDEIKEAEVPRYIRECLLINPYISAVNNIRVSFEKGTLAVTAAVATVYGEVEANVTV